VLNVDFACHYSKIGPKHTSNLANPNCVQVSVFCAAQTSNEPASFSCIAGLVRQRLFFNKNVEKIKKRLLYLKIIMYKRFCINDSESEHNFGYTWVAVMHGGTAARVGLNTGNSQSQKGRQLSG